MIRGTGRPDGGYRLDDNTRVPSVTTILGAFKDPGGLMHWAYRLGLDGKDLRKEQARGAAIGTLVHDMVEAHLVGEDVEAVIARSLLDDDDLAKARRGFDGFRKWWDMASANVHAVEVPLVSQRFRFAGTLDAVATLGGELCVLDWKTSNRVYDSHLVQLAAYGALWEETHGERPQGFHLCRFNKRSGGFAHHHFPDLEPAWRQFRHLLEAHRLKTDIQQLI